MGQELKPPIMLLGNVRSGTSMMHRLFDAHPSVKSWYEPRTVWVYANPGRSHDRFTQDDATAHVCRYIRGRFIRYQRRNDNLRVMEKTPSNLMRIPYVNAIFPEAKFLYMVREPFAYLSSSEYKWQTSINWKHARDRLFETPKTQLPHYVSRLVVDKFRKQVLKRKYVSIWGVRYPGIYEDLQQMSTEQVIAKQWARCSEQAEMDLADIEPERVLRMRYEDFVTDPITQFQRICQHFELSFPAEVENALINNVDPGRQEKWHRLDSGTVQRCLPILEPEMRRHGYSIPSEFTTIPGETNEPNV